MTTNNESTPDPSFPQSAILGVDVDGLTAWWDGQDFAGHAEIVEAAQMACLMERDIPVGFRRIVARQDTPDGAAAALAAYRPGRTRFDVAPDGLGDWLYEH